MNPSRPLPDSQISGSGSFQSHLSTTNSQQRLRATNTYAALTKESASSTSPVLLNPTTSFNTALRALLPFLDLPASIQIQDHHPPSRSWKALAFKWMVLVYCILSFTFTSTVLGRYLYRNDTFHIPAGGGLVPSTWEYTSSEQRFSRLSPRLGGSRAFDPYLLLAAPRTDVGITACVWTTDDEDSLPSLVSWVAQWAGPTSLVMATKTLPRSAAHQQLLQRLKTLQGRPSLTGLSLHLVHVMNDQYYPSAYLNLARLFAISPTVMLFPANISNLLPAQLYSVLTSQIHHPIRKPVLVTNTVTSAFSIPGLTPVILPRNYQLWCPERAFLGSRSSDWDDCLWQLWLEEYGLEHANATVPLDTEDSVGIGADAIGLTRTRNRLSGKYRAEMCELAIKRLSTDAPRMSKSGKRRLQWVKSFCRQTDNAAKNSVA
ncbi:hypothetical protein B0H17DRAFT_86770 [Mycena rosella]|uniref:Uncharacterized protein n=1 Tax=Mycena rosella TaxID=1033263 RepID=A0AAD7DZ37_MYCRO|nr:hypothetical protein B0H17DRAFT_86770 [Mycena rosella]